MPGDVTIWIIGTGTMGRAYAQILKAMNVSYLAVGRSEESCHAFTAETGDTAIPGGIESFLSTNPVLPKAAIVAATIDSMENIALALCRYGVPDILLEKPGAMSLKGLSNIRSAQSGTRIHVGFNRRFFSSVAKARDIIAQDGGITSFHFEFTEWPSRILSYTHPDGALENWLHLNSSHVIDLAFHLGGVPEKIECFSAGTTGWHTPAIFCGAGITVQNAPFSYKADWGSAGRWMVEIMTRKRKLIFAPMEQLKEQLVDTVVIQDVEIDDTLDKDFKPGLYRQVESFLSGDRQNLLTLEGQIANWHLFNRIAGRAA